MKSHHFMYNYFRFLNFHVKWTWSGWNTYAHRWSNRFPFQHSSQEIRESPKDLLSRHVNAPYWSSWGTWAFLRWPHHSFICDLKSLSHSNVGTFCSWKFMLATPLNWPDRSRDPPYLYALVLPTQLQKKVTRFECGTTSDISWTHQHREIRSGLLLWSAAVLRYGGHISSTCNIYLAPCRGHICFQKLHILSSCAVPFGRKA